MRNRYLVLIFGIIIIVFAVDRGKLVFAVSFPEYSFSLKSGRKTRALRAPISGVRRRCRLRSETGWAEFGYFLCFFKMVAPGVSRFPTAGQGERRLWERDCSVCTRNMLIHRD